MRISLLSLSAAALLGAFAIQSIRPQTALAAFHIAQINEVMVGFNGNPDIQYVEIDQPFGAQPFVGGTQLAAFGPTGNFIGIVLVVPNQVANGDTWIMGTPQFETASGIQADFEFAPGMISPTGGMVCWGATSGASAPNNHVDCLAYGNYTGPVIPSPPTETSGPGDCQRSLTRFTDATFPGPNPPTHTYAYGNNLNDFSLATATPRNNTGATGTLTATDTDLDTLADCRDPNDDNDLFPDTTDNCRLIVNNGQEDADADFAGDLCDPNSANPDIDGDTCLDGIEMRIDHVNGGQRNPLDPWDFFDVTGDQTIDLTDTIDVLGFFGDAGTSPAGNLRDRNVLNISEQWRTSEANDSIDLTDAINSLSSFGDSC